MKKAKHTKRARHCEKERKKRKKREKEGKRRKIGKFNVFKLIIYYCSKLRLKKKNLYDYVILGIKYE